MIIKIPAFQVFSYEEHETEIEMQRDEKDPHRIEITVGGTTYAIDYETLTKALNAL